MNSIQIKQLFLNDIESALEVIHKASLPRLRQEGLSEHVITEVLAKQNKNYLAKKMAMGTFFGAFDDEKLIGIIGLRSDEADPIPHRLSSFYIIPEYQKRGIGTQLFQKVKEEALQKGISKITVNSNLIAEPIYRHFGFKKIRTEKKIHQDGGVSYQVWMELVI